ncbi:FadR/GntR family transcriptional regulator [Rhizorhabdus wittichii]|uniref:FadR/GntR family transcriptional regulator n=1 Tax=Rhizorhabdus wittichii TaxID=160791 RepID=UPI001ABEF62D|nr:GntR family transcriptional regulator [Rhizorhabdus wittichii]
MVPPSASKLRSVKLGEKAANYLRKEIVEGRFKAGQSLPSETEMMAMFGISRPTLREAIRILEAMGLVVIQRGKNGGAAVRHPAVTITAANAAIYLQTKQATLLELQRARSMIEPELVRGLEGRITAEQFAELRGILARAREAMNDVGAYVGCTTAFHMALVNLMENRVLDLIVSMIHTIYEPMVAAATATNMAVGKTAFQLDVTSQEHLLDLMEAGDFAAASDFCRSNLARIARFMEESGVGRAIIGAPETDA